MSDPIRFLLDLDDRLSKWEWNKVRMVRNWVVKHRRVAAWFLLLLTGINCWIGWTIRPAHPYMAVLLAVESWLFLVGMSVTYYGFSGPGPRLEP